MDGRTETRNAINSELLLNELVRGTHRECNNPSFSLAVTETNRPAIFISSIHPIFFHFFHFSVTPSYYATDATFEGRREGRDCE